MAGAGGFKPLRGARRPLDQGTQREGVSWLEGAGGVVYGQLTPSL
jgi:hypothetical protein